MDFVEEYSVLQKPKTKKILLIAGAVGFCGLVLFLSFTSFSHTDNESNSPAILKQSLELLPSSGDDKGQTEQTQTSRSRQGSVIKIPKQGRIRGTILTSRKGREYYAFYKIPYAQPPVGELRFQSPKTPKRWFGIRDGTKPGPQCIQKEKYAPVRRSTGEEDCLFLNIYTPELPTRRGPQPKLPVLFYLHGGGVTGNGTRYGAQYFMDEPVILITSEFRAGLLSSFSTGTPEFPGNYGSKDQVFALKWVQRNIKEFGGDPERVMIFGNSGGGSAAACLLLSDMSRGLFSRAILQSGNCIMTSREAPGKITAASLTASLAEEVGCSGHINNPQELTHCLREVNATELVLTKTQEIEAGYFPEPIPENGDLSDTFFTDQPWNLLKQGRSHKVPIMLGNVEEESLSFDSYEILFNTTLTRSLNDNWNKVFPAMMNVPDDANHTMSTRFRYLYFGDKVVSNDTRFELMQIFSDRFVHPQRLTALNHLQSTGESVYLYWITKFPARSYGEKYQAIYPPPYNVTHADELQYLFLYDGYPEITLDSPWYNYSDALVKMWSSFAATGDPNSPNGDWHPIKLEDNGMKWYELGDRFGEIEPGTERMLLWDDYIDEIYQPPKKL